MKAGFVLPVKSRTVHELCEMVCTQGGRAWSLIMDCNHSTAHRLNSFIENETKASKILNTIILGFNPLSSQLGFGGAQPSSWLAFILAALFSFLQSARKVIKDNLRLRGPRETI